MNTEPIKNKMNTNIKGVLADAYLRNPAENKISFDVIKNSLFINSSDKYYSGGGEYTEKDSSFDCKKALIPLFAGAAVIAGGCFLLSAVLKKSSSALLNTKRYEQLPDLAVNMNIKEEPEFAIYRAVRNPDSRNIAAAAGVFLMSGITIAAKNFADGLKEIWLKKRSADIEKNLQENLITVERDAFSGKLKTVNDIMTNTVKEFEEIINSNSEKTACFKSGGKQEIFESFSPSFKRKADKNKRDNSGLKFFLTGAAAAAGLLLLGKLSLANFRKSVQNANDFARNFELKVINALENTCRNAENGKKTDVSQITELLKSIPSNSNLINKVCKSLGLTSEKARELTNEIEKSRNTIFADAPQSLGGIPKKVQYYCYLDEPRGHLYNWLVNPGNKFTKMIFGAFTLAGAAGYSFNLTADALKQTAVMKENAKTELNLKKRLVQVEIQNFKAKKECAAAPLIDSFKKQASEGGKSKEELKHLADNILTEIKNSPPYVFG